MSENAVLAALRRMGIGKGGDERARFSGHGDELSWMKCWAFRPDYIEHQLAHVVRDPLGRAYNRTAHLPQRRKMMQEWADYLDRLRAGEVDTRIGTTVSQGAVTVGNETSQILKEPKASPRLHSASIGVQSNHTTSRRDNSLAQSGELVTG